MAGICLGRWMDLIIIGMDSMAGQTYQDEFAHTVQRTLCICISIVVQPMGYLGVRETECMNYIAHPIGHPWTCVGKEFNGINQFLEIFKVWGGPWCENTEAIGCNQSLPKSVMYICFFFSPYTRFSAENVMIFSIPFWSAKMKKILDIWAKHANAACALQKEKKKMLWIEVSETLKYVD